MALSLNDLKKRRKTAPVSTPEKKALRPWESFDEEVYQQYQQELLSPSVRRQERIIQETKALTERNELLIQKVKGERDQVANTQGLKTTGRNGAFYEWKQARQPGLLSLIKEIILG